MEHQKITERRRAEEHKNRKETNVVQVVAIVSILILVLLVVYACGADKLFSNIEKQGQFGDQFGAINALFSGLAFTLLIGTIILQSRELKAQRNELQLTRDELAKASTAQRELVEAQLLSARISGLASLIDAQIPFIDTGLRKGYVPSDGSFGEQAHGNLEELCQQIRREIKASNIRYGR